MLPPQTGAPQTAGQTSHSRNRILTRSRVYLAGLIAGGLAASGGFAMAASGADSATSHARHGNGSVKHRHRAAHAHTPSAQPSPSAPSSRQAQPSRPAVRAAKPSKTATPAPAPAPAPPPAASTHAS